MPEAIVNGVRLYFRDEGQGTPFVVLHGGLGFDHSYMRPAFEPFEDRARFIYLDQRGNGRSDRPSLDTVTIPQLADDVETLRSHLGLDRIGVVGHSYGGFVALQYATTYPATTSHLIALDTSPGAFEPTEQELAERPDPSWITPEIEKGFAMFASGPPPSEDEFRSRFPEIAPIYLKNLAPADLAGILDDVILDAKTAGASMAYLRTGWSVASELGKIDCPTLVLCGRYDLLTTPECSKRLSTAIPGAELVWFENSGHFPELEEPDAFRAAVGSFLSRHA